MLDRAWRSTVEAEIENIRFYQADAERLPLQAASIDVALVNGIFNLNPAREMIFQELARVVRPGGAVYAAEMILREPLSMEEFRAAGFQEVKLLRAYRNARTKNPLVLAAEVWAKR